MSIHNVTLPLPESLYLRFQRMAQATHQPVADLLVRAVEVGEPPSWEEAPARFQADLAALDRLDDNALWRIARGQRNETEVARLHELLEKRADIDLTAAERQELEDEVLEADRFMLRKAHAAALLRWRGHAMPPPERL